MWHITKTSALLNVMAKIFFNHHNNSSYMGHALVIGSHLESTSHHSYTVNTYTSKINAFCKLQVFQLI